MSLWGLYEERIFRAVATSFKSKLRFARAFASRRFTLFWIGQTISYLGNNVFNLALAWQVLLMTHSGTAMGVVLFTESIPQLFFVLIGGVAADRLPRRMILLWSDGGRGLVVLLVAFLGFTGRLQFWHLVIEAVIFGMASGFFDPALRSIPPELVAKEDLASANALQSLSANLARLLGPALGAVLIALITPMGAFVANALSFFLSVAFLLAMRIPARQLVSPGAAGAGRRGRGFMVADVWEAVKYVRGVRWLWVGILASTIGSFALIPPLYVTLPLLVSKVYGQGPWLLGLINAADAIGSTLALLAVGQAARLGRRGVLAYLSLVLPCLGFIFMGLPFPHGAAPVVASLGGAMVGFGLAFFNTTWFTIVQEKVPGEKLGRVVSLATLGDLALAPAAQGIGGILTDALGPAMVCVLGGSLGLAAVLAPLGVRDIRAMN